MLNKRFVIYRITDIASRSCYVGVTGQTLAARWRIHINDAKRGGTHPLAVAIREHGRDAFEISALEEVDGRAESRAAERRWIAALNSMVPHGYNATSGGDGVPGMKHSEATLATMRARVQPPSERANRRAALQGLACGPMTDAIKQKISTSLRANGQHRAATYAPRGGGRQRPVIVDGVLYPCIAECARALGVTRPAVSYWLAVGTARVYREPIVIDGVVYRSRHAAALALGLSATAIRHRIRNDPSVRRHDSRTSD